MSSSKVKLRDVLQTIGNVLVPGYGNIPQVNAQDKLKYLVESLQKEEGWTIEQIQFKVDNI